MVEVAVLILGMMLAVGGYYTHVIAKAKVDEVLDKIRTDEGEDITNMRGFKWVGLQLFGRLIGLGGLCCVAWGIYNMIN